MLTMKKNRTRLIGPAAVVAGVAVLAPAGSVVGQCEYDVTVIKPDWASPRGGEAVTALAINEHGHVVGNYWDGMSLYAYPFLWTPEEGFIALPLPPAAHGASCEDINDRGVIVGTAILHDVGDRAFVYKDGQYTILPPAQGKGWSSAIAINNKGEVAGTRSIADGVVPENAYFWSEATGFIDLGLMDAPKTAGIDINDSSQLTGRRGIPASSDEAFIWDDGELLFLGPIPGGTTSTPAGINNQGQIAGAGLIEEGGSEEPTVRSFFWNGGVMSPLGGLSGYAVTTARGLNDSGQVVGSCVAYIGSSDWRGFLWQNGSLHDLNDLMPPAVGLIERAWDVNNSGLIVGDGVSPGSCPVAFLLTPINRPDGDVDCNCTVDVSDLLWVLQEWHKTDSVADVNDDCIVDVLDLLIVLGDWG